MIRPKFGYYGTIGPAVGFTWAEARCTDGTMPTGRAKMECVRVARQLNLMRKGIAKRYGIKFTDVTIAVNSWFRSYHYQTIVLRGVPNSQHLYGKAVDVRVWVRLRNGRRVQLHPRFVALLGARYVPAFAGGGIGWYDRAHGWFTHFDIRKGRARWINKG